MEFSRQEYWNGLPFLPPENLLDPGIESMSLVSPALAGRLKPPGKPINVTLPSQAPPTTASSKPTTLGTSLVVLRRPVLSRSGMSDSATHGL